MSAVTLATIGMERATEPLRQEGQSIEQLKAFLADGSLPRYSLLISIDLIRPLFAELGTYESIRESRNVFPVADPYLTAIPEFEIMKTKLPLSLTLAGLSALALAAFFELPYPFNVVSLLAILGPGTVTAYGLRTQPN